MRLLFISNRFPDASEPDRGLDSVNMLQMLRDRWEIRVVALRPVWPWGARGWHPRADDVAFHPEFVATPMIPIMGARVNHTSGARALVKPLDRLRRDWQFDAVLCSWLYPDACAVADLVGRFHFRFVAVAVGGDVDQCLGSSASRKVIASHLAGASGVVTSSSVLISLLSKTGFRKDRVTFSSNWQTAAEACHRLLLPVRH